MANDQMISFPPSMTPRPGEDVVYYKGQLKFKGKFLGYDVQDQPIVSTETGSARHLSDYISVRLADPHDRSGGCYSEAPPSTVVLEASVAERTKLQELLSRHIQPGPRYIDLIEEIWARGYEVFLVGGSVRDVLNGDDPNDVDLVSTIPFFFLASVAESMFGSLGFSRHAKNGFMSIGYNAGSRNRGDQGTLIDVKNFFSIAPGTDEAEFGSNIDFDHRMRDFSCNAIYYDPINNKFVDPCGHGIEDARQRVLNVVNDPSISNPIHRQAHIAMRMFKFMLRDYTPSEQCLRQIRDVYGPRMQGCKPDEIWKLYYRTVLAKTRENQRAEVFWSSKALIIESGFGDIWETFLQHKETEFRARK